MVEFVHLKCRGQHQKKREIKNTHKCDLERLKCSESNARRHHVTPTDSTSLLSQYLYLDLSLDLSLDLCLSSYLLPQHCCHHMSGYNLMQFVSVVYCTALFQHNMVNVRNTPRHILRCSHNNISINALNSILFNLLHKPPLMQLQPPIAPIAKGIAENEKLCKLCTF